MLYTHIVVGRRDVAKVVHQRHLHRQTLLDVNRHLARRRADAARRREAALPCIASSGWYSVPDLSLFGFISVFWCNRHLARHRAHAAWRREAALPCVTSRGWCSKPDWNCLSVLHLSLSASSTSHAIAQMPGSVTLPCPAVAMFVACLALFCSFGSHP